MKLALKGTAIVVNPYTSKLAETAEEKIKSMKNIRAIFLSDTDWTQVSDSPLDEQTKEAWRVWRQELRDITNIVNVDNVGDYFEISDPPTKNIPERWADCEYERFQQVTETLNNLLKEQQH